MPDSEGFIVCFHDITDIKNELLPRTSLFFNYSENLANISGITFY